MRTYPPPPMAQPRISGAPRGQIAPPALGLWHGRGEPPTHVVFESNLAQIMFVPDSMGRFFLTVSLKSINLWTLEPDGLPHVCRQIFPVDPLSEKEMIVKALVSRPKGSMVAYLAVQYTQS